MERKREREREKKWKENERERERRNGKKTRERERERRNGKKTEGGKEGWRRKVCTRFRFIDSPRRTNQFSSHSLVTRKIVNFNKLFLSFHKILSLEKY